MKSRLTTDCGALLRLIHGSRTCQSDSRRRHIRRARSTRLHGPPNLLQVVGSYRQGGVRVVRPLVDRGARDEASPLALVRAQLFLGLLEGIDDGRCAKPPQGASDLISERMLSAQGSGHHTFVSVCARSSSRRVGGSAPGSTTNPPHPGRQRKSGSRSGGRTAHRRAKRGRHDESSASHGRGPASLRRDRRTGAIRREAPGDKCSSRRVGYPGSVTAHVMRR